MSARIASLSKRLCLIGASVPCAPGQIAAHPFCTLQPPAPKICIYGAGAIGGWIGARLAAQGCKLNVVARGATLTAIQRHGLRLSEGGVETAHTVECASDPRELGVQDVVVVAVKSPALSSVAAEISPLLGPDTIVLTAMNGVPWWFLDGMKSHGMTDTWLKSVDPHRELGRAMPLQHVLGCVVHLSCSVDEPGLIRHRGGNRLIIGEPSGEMSQRAAALGETMERSGIDVTLSSNIQQDIWFKLWGNMTMNPMSALTGATCDLMLDDPLVRDFTSKVMLEAQQIGGRIGIKIDQKPEDRHAVTRKLGALRTSMLQDHEARRAVELDALVGAVQELGTLTGVETPFTDALFGLSRVQAQVRGLYPKPN